MRTIHQGHLPVRTLVLIGMVILITAQAYAQNANARLTITLRNATLKEFVKLIENSTGYSFIYSEEISISHKINLKVKDMPLHEILDLVFKNEPISYKFSERYILLQKKRVQKPVSRKFTISGYVTDGTSSETLTTERGKVVVSLPHGTALPNRTSATASPVSLPPNHTFRIEGMCSLSQFKIKGRPVNRSSTTGLPVFTNAFNKSC